MADRPANLRDNESRVLPQESFWNTLQQLRSMQPRVQRENDINGRSLAYLLDELEAEATATGITPQLEHEASALLQKARQSEQPPQVEEEPDPRLAEVREKTRQLNVVLDRIEDTPGASADVVETGRDILDAVNAAITGGGDLTVALRQATEMTEVLISYERMLQNIAQYETAQNDVTRLTTQITHEPLASHIKNARDTAKNVIENGDAGEATRILQDALAEVTQAREPYARAQQKLRGLIDGMQPLSHAEDAIIHPAVRNIEDAARIGNFELAARLCADIYEQLQMERSGQEPHLSDKTAAPEEDQQDTVPEGPWAESLQALDVIYEEMVQAGWMRVPEADLAHLQQFVPESLSETDDLSPHYIQTLRIIHPLHGHPDAPEGRTFPPHVGFVRLSWQADQLETGISELDVSRYQDAPIRTYAIVHNLDVDSAGDLVQQWHFYPLNYNNRKAAWNADTPEGKRLLSPEFLAYHTSGWVGITSTMLERWEQGGIANFAQHTYLTVVEIKTQSGPMYFAHSGDAAPTTYPSETNARLYAEYRIVPEVVANGTQSRKESRLVRRGSAEGRSIEGDAMEALLTQENWNHVDYALVDQLMNGMETSLSSPYVSLAFVSNPDGSMRPYIHSSGRCPRELYYTPSEGYNVAYRHFRVHPRLLEDGRVTYHPVKIESTGASLPDADGYTFEKDTYLAAGDDMREKTQEHIETFMNRAQWVTIDPDVAAAWEHDQHTFLSVLTGAHVALCRMDVPNQEPLYFMSTNAAASYPVFPEFAHTIVVYETQEAVHGTQLRPFRTFFQPPHEKIEQVAGSLPIVRESTQNVTTPPERRRQTVAEQLAEDPTPPPRLSMATVDGDIPSIPMTEASEVGAKTHMPQRFAPHRSRLRRIGGMIAGAALVIAGALGLIRLAYIERPEGESDAGDITVPARREPPRKTSAQARQVPPPLPPEAVRPPHIPDAIPTTPLPRREEPLPDARIPQQLGQESSSVHSPQREGVSPTSGSVAEGGAVIEQPTIPAPIRSEATPTGPRGSQDQATQTIDIVPGGIIRTLQHYLKEQGYKPKDIDRMISRAFRASVESRHGQNWNALRVSPGDEIDISIEFDEAGAPQLTQVEVRPLDRLTRLEKKAAEHAASKQTATPDTARRKPTPADDIFGIVTQKETYSFAKGSFVTYSGKPFIVVGPSTHTTGGLILQHPDSRRTITVQRVDRVEDDPERRTERSFGDITIRKVRGQRDQYHISLRNGGVQEALLTAMQRYFHIDRDAATTAMLIEDAQARTKAIPGRAGAQYYGFPDKMHVGDSIDITVSGTMANPRIHVVRIDKQRPDDTAL